MKGGEEEVPSSSAWFAVEAPFPGRRQGAMWRQTMWTTHSTSAENAPQSVRQAHRLSNT